MCIDVAAVPCSALEFSKFFTRPRVSKRWDITHPGNTAVLIVVLVSWAAMLLYIWLTSQLSIIAGQLCLASTAVLVVGAGGLGCPAAIYLAAAGIGKIVTQTVLISFSELRGKVKVSYWCSSTVGTSYYWTVFIFSSDMDIIFIHKTDICRIKIKFINLH